MPPVPKYTRVVLSFDGGVNRMPAMKFSLDANVRKLVDQILTTVPRKIYKGVGLELGLSKQ